MKLARLSFQRKLTLLVLAATVLALGMAVLGLALYDRYSSRDARTRELTLLASAIGSNVAASMVFNAPKTAADILEALHADHDIVAARLYDNAGHIFTEYVRADLPSTYSIPPLPADTIVFTADSVVLTMPVSMHGEKDGSIVLISNLQSLDAKLWQYVRMATLVLLLAVLTTHLISERFLRIALQPVLQLADIAGRASNGDFTLRASFRSSDEIGVLTNSFNDMLDAIQQRDNALQSANDELEFRVQARIEELQLQVNERQLTEETLSQERQVLRALIDNVPDYMYVRDTQGRYLLANAMFARALRSTNSRSSIGKRNTSTGTASTFAC